MIQNTFMNQFRTQAKSSHRRTDKNLIRSSDQNTKFLLTPDAFKLIIMILVPVFENLQYTYTMEGTLYNSSGLILLTDL